MEIKMKNKFSLHEAAAEGSFVLQNQKPGRIVNGKFVPINIGALSAADKKKLESDLSRYATERERKYGKGQLQKDIQTSQRVAKEQEAKRKAEAEAKAKAQKPPAQGTPTPSPTPQQTPATPPAPAPARPAATTPAPSTPAPAAPKPSPVADYMKAAAAARRSGDPAEMAKVKDMGMEIWRKSNPKLAAAADERARIRGTAQTDNPLMKDMRSRLPVTPTVQAPAVKDLGLGQQSLSQNQYAGRSPEPKIQVSKDATMNKTAETLSKNPLPKKEQPVKKEAYDIVLDYLLSEGHADTLSEAHYVMLQMDTEHIRNIVEAQRVLAQKTINGVTVPGYVNVEKQGGFLGFGGKNVPVKGSFRPANVPSSAAARYNVGIDKTLGTGTGTNAMPAYRVQQRARNQGHSGYMRVANPESLPNTGIPDRPTPQRAGDQNRAINLLRPDVPTTPTKPASKPKAKDPFADDIAAMNRQIAATPPGKDPEFYRPPAAKPKITMTDAEFDKKYSWAMNPSKAVPAATSTPSKSTAPRTSRTTAKDSTPKPQPPTIQSKNVTAGGIKYERRTPTSAELAASKAAGGGEAGVKAAVDVAKTNQVAATSPTPDLKPKKESLAAQVKALQAMRKSSEERQKQ
jgi:hypothetical protein